MARRSPGSGSFILRGANKALLRVTTADGRRVARTVAVAGVTDASPAGGQS